MRNFYFTFGSGHPHANCYHVIEAENQTIARKQMNERFGNKWSMCYDSAEAAGVDKFGLTEIK